MSDSKMTVNNPGVFIFNASNLLEPIQISGWGFVKEKDIPTVKEVFLVVLDHIKQQGLRQLEENKYELEQNEDGTYGTDFCILEAENE